MNRRWPRWDPWYLLYGLGVVVGLLLAWWPYATQRDLDEWAVRLREKGVPTQAVIYDLVIKRHGRSQTMHLRYDFDGRTRTGEVGCWAVCEPAGTPVRIWVNPADPTDFVAEFGTLSGNRGRIQGGFGCAGAILALISGGAAISRRGSQRRRKRPQKPRLVSHLPGRDRLVRRRRQQRRRRQRKHKS